MTATMWKTVWQTVTDAFPQILWRGLLTTLPLTALAFALSMLIAVAVAYIQYIGGTLSCLQKFIHPLTS